MVGVGCWVCMVSNNRLIGYGLLENIFKIVY